MNNSITNKKNIMKNRIFIIGILMITASLAFISCKKSSDPENVNIEGIYNGSFTTSPSLKSTVVEGVGTGEGTAQVTMMDNHQIQVHCFGEEIDTTFMLDYYTHNDSVMVCLTGDDFEGMYGHMLGDGHMGGGMMGDIQNGETEWMHHMNDEHESDDMHFGGFDMDMGSFSYSFEMMDGSSPYYLTFKGSKK
jgi:hypothetical protein